VCSLVGGAEPKATKPISVTAGGQRHVAGILADHDAPHDGAFEPLKDHAVLRDVNLIDGGCESVAVRPRAGDLVLGDVEFEELWQVDALRRLLVALPSGAHGHDVERRTQKRLAAVVIRRDS